MNASDVVADLKDTFALGHTRSLEWRLSQLAALQEMLTKHQKEWELAIQKDLGKSRVEAFLTEIAQVIAEVKDLRKHLKQWMRPVKARTPLALAPASSWVQYDPIGTVLIIAPWNYPAQLLLSPLAGAIAGGNCAVLKPSEVAPNVEALLKKLVPLYFDLEAIDIVTGGPEVVSELIAAKPDKVFFTGSTRVGTIIAEQCAQHLIPTVLELGGKSPVYVHKDADLKVAARRLVWAKFTNAGQTCVAPDHVYVHEKVAPQLTKLLQKEIARAFGKNPEKSKFFGRIINTRNAERLAQMLTAPGDAEIVCGGTAKPLERYIAPTVIANVAENHPAMQEEIFGPILPLLTVSSPEEAVARINKREHPLAAYVFTSSKKLARSFLDAVPSGGGAVNAAVIHIATPYIPFGGIGASGQGNYHGWWSFKAFTHERGVLSKATQFDTFKLLAAPINKRTEFLFRNVMLPNGKTPGADRRAAKRANKRSRNALGEYLS